MVASDREMVLPEYSVLMSLYKKENPFFLAESIDSMLNQSLEPKQIVIVKDGPLTQALEDVLERYARAYPDKFVFVENETNIGLGLSLNKGLTVCDCDYVARMDTDDISLPDRCRRELVELMADARLSIVGSNVDEFIGDPNQVISTRRVPSSYEDIYQFAKRRSAFNHPAVMYKRDDVLAVGGYSDLRRNQDVDLFGRMLFAGFKAKNIDESLLLFRSGDSLAKRRKSWENTKSYIGTIWNFVKIGYSSYLDFVLVSLAQLGLFVCPAKVQGLIYKIFFP